MFEVIVMNFSLIFKKSFLVLFFYMLFSMQAVFGDDTEIFFAPEEDTANIIPNVMFIIDTSGSMTNTVAGTNPAQSRIEVVKEVMDEVLTDITNVNVGLMRFNRGDTSGANSAEGGPVVFPVTFIDEPADPSISALVSDGINDGAEVDAIGTVTLDAEFLSLGDTNNVTAVRFDTLLIPQGATITSANLVFTANGDTSDVATLKVDAELVDDSAVLDTSVFSISTRKANATSNLVSWIPGAWTNGEPYASPDLSTVVQEVVDQVGWCGGNAMTFFIDGDALRSAYTAEGSFADSDSNNFYPSPKLKVKFDNTLPGGASGCTAVELSSRVNTNSHDWERSSGGSYAYHSGDLDVYYRSGRGSNSRNDGFGISFTNINIPIGATITDAYITFTPIRNEWANGEMDIKGVNIANPNPTNASTLFAAATLGPVNWQLNPWVRNVPVNTSDISSIVQSIVNLGGWNIGNTMSFYLEGVSGYHSARSYNNSHSRAPILTIAYSGTYEPGIITKREEMKAAVADFPADAWTPISDTMAEAGRYFKGDKVYYGIDRDNVRRNVTSHVDSFDATGTLVTPIGCTTDNYHAAVCAAEKITGNPNYISPITDSCQTSHIVFLTDGYPSSHHSATNDIYNDWSGQTCSSSSYGSDCAKKIAGYLHNNDQNPNLTGSQTVTTHTIGFEIDFPLLRDMASEGGGSYYTADNKDGLIDAINSIVTDIASVNTTFVSAGVSVNQFNRVTHNDELYFSLFAPAAGNIWPGNMKRYKLDGNQIVDYNLQPAVGVSGEFTEGAQSWWSDTVDGKSVVTGGIAGERNYGSIVYSNISGSSLTSGVNAVRDSNPSVTEVMLGAIDAADRTDILNWTQGLDVNALPAVQAHNVIGDPLHSQPNLVIYNTGTVDSPIFETKVYVGTNHGFLHAIDSETGADLWSFIPKELLSRLSDLQKASAVPHGYGLDGSITTYISDDNNNGVVDISEGEKVYLYVGMRRGGSSYYALDISDPTLPSLLFSERIHPGKAGFGSLGQTWSTPIIKKMNIGGTENRLVMLFGGGYDDDQDTAGTSANTDDVGNLVYIVDAVSGDHIWDSRGVTAIQAASPAGSISDMNGVVGEVSALDLTADGLIDVFYVADTKAQIFRFDVDNDTQLITGGKIASLQTAADVTNNRRFYYKPDTALIRTTQETFISISIGSGYRAHPLDKNIDDNFYMIKDKGGLSATFDMHVTRDNLTDITLLVGDLDNDGISDASEAMINQGAKGWYLTFDIDGEKVIERSVTFNNAVIFTTYYPPGSGSNVCEAVTGNGRLYAVKITDGSPYRDNLGDGFDESDRIFDIDIPGPPPPPMIIIGDDIGMCIGTQCDLGHLLPPTPDGIMGIRWRKN